MKISYDTEADALYIRIASGEFARNQEVLPGVILDIGPNEEVLGIEILEARRRYPLKELAHVDISMPLEVAEPQRLSGAAEGSVPFVLTALPRLLHLTTRGGCS